MGDFVKGAQRDLAAVKDRVTMVKAGDEIAPGIAVLDTPAHTPGHLSLEVAGGEGLIITADATTNQIVSFEHPEWKFGFDADPTQAIDTRKKLLDRAAADKIKLLGFHGSIPAWAFPKRRTPPGCTLPAEAWRRGAIATCRGGPREIAGREGVGADFVGDPSGVGRLDAGRAQIAWLA